MKSPKSQTKTINKPFFLIDRSLGYAKTIRRLAFGFSPRQLSTISPGCKKKKNNNNIETPTISIIVTKRQTLPK